MSYRRPSTYQAITYSGNFLGKGCNRSKAFRLTFPDSKANPKTINECASKFHKLLDVQYQIWRIRAILRGEIPRNYPLELHDAPMDCRWFVGQ